MRGGFAHGGLPWLRGRRETKAEHVFGYTHRYTQLPPQLAVPDVIKPSINEVGFGPTKQAEAHFDDLEDGL